MASISFKCTDEEKELIRRTAEDTIYGSMSGYCHYIIMAATKAIDNARNGTEYKDVYPIGKEDNTLIYKKED